MMIKKCVMAAALCLGALTAQAAGAVNDLGLLRIGALTPPTGDGQNGLGLPGSSADLSFSAVGDASPGSFFFHLYHFQLDTPAALTGSFQDLVGVTLDKIKLVSNRGFEWLDLGAGLNFAYDNVAEGYYALYVFGSRDGGASSFSGNMMAQPVPEPETYAMLLAGLGMIGAAVARRRKSR